MRRAVSLLLSVAMLAGAASVARAETAENFLRRFLVDPAATIGGKAKPVARAGKKAPETPLVDVPLPRLRPVHPPPTVLGYQGNDISQALETETINGMPLPRLRPVTAAAASAALRSSLPVTTAAVAPKTVMTAALVPEPPKEPLPKLILPPPAATSICGMAIAKLGVIAEPISPIDGEGECGVAEPVEVTALEGGDVKLVGTATVGCAVAERLATWVKDTMAPKVEEAMGEKLTALRIADSYSCRTRNNQPDAKISEHGKGNAIDISAIRAGKRWIEVGPGWKGGGEDGALLADISKSACGPFTTVLGPGSDAFHDEHLHLDMIQRRTAGPSKGLYCK